MGHGCGAEGDGIPPAGPPPQKYSRIQNIINVTNCIFKMMEDALIPTKPDIRQATANIQRIDQMKDRSKKL